MLMIDGLIDFFLSSFQQGRRWPISIQYHKKMSKAESVNNTNDVIAVLFEHTLLFFGFLDDEKGEDCPNTLE